VQTMLGFLAQGHVSDETLTAIRAYQAQYGVTS